MKLHQNLELFEQLQTLTATMKEIDLDPSIIEKDYWVTFALKRLSLHKKVIFKGGTSLFKAYRFLNRFSEDIDVTFTERVNRNTIRNIEKAVMSSPFEALNDSSQYADKKGSEFRSVAYEYPRKSKHVIENLKPYIVYESYTFDLTFPWAKKEVGSLISDYLKKNGRYDIIEEYELEPFSLNVLDIRRTFFDKVFAVHESLTDRKHVEVYARHVYDLCRMIERNEIQDAYNSGEAKRLYKEFLDARIKMSGSSIDETFDINTYKIRNLTDNAFKSGFDKFQKQLVFPNETIRIDRINDLIRFLTEYDYD